MIPHARFDPLNHARFPNCRDTRYLGVAFVGTGLNGRAHINANAGRLLAGVPGPGMRRKNGWQMSGLPWTYDLDPDKMALPEREETGEIHPGNAED